MKRTIYFIAILGLLACSSAEAPEGSAGQQKAEATATKTMVKQDTIKPANEVRGNRVNYIMDTSRPLEEMNADFPYDIELHTAEGKKLMSSDVLQNDGKPLVVLFWLTTCMPCKLQMNQIEKVYDQWVDETGVKLLAISTDFQKNGEKFQQMVKEKDWPWDAYHDWNREFRRVMPGGLNGMPQTFLFDKNGKIVYHKRKYRPGDENILYDEIIKLSKE